MAKKKVDKYVERAGEILAKIAKKNLAKIKPVDEALKSLRLNSYNIKSIERKFDAGRIELLYQFFKSKYFHYPEFPAEIEKMIKKMKKYLKKNDAKSLNKAREVYLEINSLIKEFENKLLIIEKGYKPKFI